MHSYLEVGYEKPFNFLITQYQTHLKVWAAICAPVFVGTALFSLKDTMILHSYISNGEWQVLYDEKIIDIRVSYFSE